MSRRLTLNKTKLSKFYLAVSVSLITFIVYLSALHNEFVLWDDSRYIFENPNIRSFDKSLLKWAFFDFYAGNWHPLTWLSHAFDYAVWGLNPSGHHLINNILHAINTFLVVLLIMKLLEIAKERTTEASPSEFLTKRTLLMAGGVTGLLFGLHPLHVESVAWVSERKDLLCALFFLLSILQYTKYAGSVIENTQQRNPFLLLSNKRYLLALALFILALLSKPMAVTLPVVLVILDWYPFNRITSLKIFRSVLAEKLPFIVLSFIVSILSILAQKTEGAVVPIEKASLLSRSLVSTQSLVLYLGKMIWPLNLVPIYPYPRDASLLSLKYITAIILVTAITAGCVIMVKRGRKVWLAGWIYYVVTLLPVIGIIQVGGQAMADRYTYLPSIGPFLILGLGSAWIWGKEVGLKKFALIAKVASTITVIIVAVALSYLTFIQIGIWGNSIDLWTYVIKRYPDKIYIAYNNRGMAYDKMGQFGKAIEDYNHAITISPAYIYAYYNRAVALGRNGQFEKAIKDFSRSIELDPSYFMAYNGRGMLYEKEEQPDRAIKDYNKAIELNPFSPDAYFNLGVLYGKSGLYDKAMTHFNEAIAINPDNAVFYCNRAAIYSFIGQHDNALKDLNKAIEIDRNIATAYYNRALIYLKAGMAERAIADLQTACNLGDKQACKLIQR